MILITKKERKSIFPVTTDVCYCIATTMCSQLFIGFLEWCETAPPGTNYCLRYPVCVDSNGIAPLPTSTGGRSINAVNVIVVMVPQRYICEHAMNTSKGKETELIRGASRWPKQTLES